MGVLHGQLSQNKRTLTFLQYCNASSGVLIATDVAARGLDIPTVDWIVQFDPPVDPREYIHRVGRTARAGKSGNALLFLLPEEVGFLSYLKHCKVPLNEYEFPTDKLNDQIQQQLEGLVEHNYYLRQSAKQAYRGYLLAYASHQLKNIFRVGELDQVAVAKSFGLPAPPACSLSLADLATRSRRRDGPKGPPGTHKKRPNQFDPFKSALRGDGGGDTQWSRM
eukprot:NODE_1787_length_759_cov_129.426761_g1495_i0.p1 GENE.NODE_1787_length_759_cov_129.426761_g1495_i0~~NODE_1787_length_759_cov_129.426761_g1495_i0.p1  ORF type:complete len:229 (-),score=98.33 NODE_1787_length_759_cov_129.426761_g1495_i0:71-736(-)